MATATVARQSKPGIPPYPIHRLTVGQYHRMIEEGILTEDDRVELLEGWLVPKMPHKPSHDGTIWLLQTALLPLLPAEWVLRIQSSITTADSEPEPDLAIARGPGNRYLTMHPGPRDIGVLMEVADTTLIEDRNDKGRLYARARIPIYWLVNLLDSRIEVYSLPKAGKLPAYRRRQDYNLGQNGPLILGGSEIALIPVQELLQ
jgi:hypothetical protein